jgi:hypothetical protein
MKIVNSAAIRKLLKNHLAMGSVGSPKSSSKFAAVGRIGIQFGFSHSFSGLIAVIAIQTKGKMKKSPNRISKP